MQSSQPDKSWLTDTLLLTCFFTLLFFIGLGSRPLFTPDEGRYAEIAREMVTSGDYLTPTLNGIKYFEKPILFYWLGAAAIKVGGVNILAVRCINALIALFGCLLTYLAGRQLFDRATGVIGALVLGTSTLYFVMAHMVSLDLPVSVFLAASLYGFLLAAVTENPVISQRYLMGAALAAAFAVLTKGLIGLVLPALIAGTWIALTSEWRQLKRLPLIKALLVFIIVAAPWHILVNIHNPEFFHFYFIEQHFLRYTTLEVGHYQPAWFFIPTLLAGFFPWIVFLPQTIAYSFRRNNKRELFLLIWAVLIFAFFSFSKSKLIPYILPVVPALALLVGRYLANHLQRSSRSLQAGYLCLFIFAATITYFLWNLSITVSNPMMATLTLRCAIILLLLGSIINLLLMKQKPSHALICTFISTALFLMISQNAIQFIDTRTVKPLATIINTLRQSDDVVVTYNQYYQDLPFYIKQKIIILNWRNELSFGMQHQKTEDWMINYDQFWKLWHSKKRVLMIMSKPEYENFRERHPHETMVIISETPTNALVTNSPLAITPS